MVIASLPSPVTVNTPPATFALTAAFAMPGNARAAATATPAIGIELFHFVDTGPPGALGMTPKTTCPRIYSPLMFEGSGRGRTARTPAEVLAEHRVEVQVLLGAPRKAPLGGLALSPP
jgi:hypothetical protein